MHQEVEAKAWIYTSEEEIRILDFLKKSGKYKGRVIKNDTYFARPGSEVFEFRLREKNGIFFVNQKNHKLVGKLEQNEELEFEISDGKAFEELTQKLGYVVFLKKEKRNEVYELGKNFIAELVEVPTLGKFLEIEIICEFKEEIPEARKKIEGIFEKLDLTKNIEKKQYSVLLKTINKS